jgi:outer membrane biosynthesis protein TonB
MFGLGKEKEKKPEVKPSDPGSSNEPPIDPTPETDATVKETGIIPEPEKTQEEEPMTLTSKKEPETKKEVLKIDGKEVRSVYEFKTYIVYDFVGGGRKKVMKKDVKKEEEK